MRQLATIQKISAIRPIPGADAIEAADVLGWTVVVKKGEFSVGDLVVYFEVDSWLDASNPAFASFEERFVNWGSKRGMRLKTIKLRKQVSQGLILSIGTFPELFPSVRGSAVKLGDDVTSALKIEKWEAPEEKESNSAGSKAQKTRPFPWFLRVTDQNRIQNVGDLVFQADAAGTTWEVSKKLDGSSLTVFYIGRDTEIFKEVLAEMRARAEAKMGVLKRLATRLARSLRLSRDPEFIYGVCSRNVWLDVDGDNHFSAMAREVRNRIALMGLSSDALAFQGELVAPNIQSNYEKVNKPEWYVFDVFDIDSQEYLLPEGARTTVESFGLNYVPVVDAAMHISSTKGGGFEDVRQMTDHILGMAEGPGMNPGVKREGLVFKSNQRSDVSFKAISNSYLLKKG